MNSTQGSVRMKTEDRRELILAAATRVFGDYGYIGATTDQVARAAEVSQPYVVRMFGSKEKLFLAVCHRAQAKVLETFRAVLANPEPDLPLIRQMGRAYVGLASDRGILLSLMHAFVLGSEPTIGADARCGFLEIFEFLRVEAGFDPEEVRQMLSAGMLVNTMVGIRMADEYDSNPLAKELLDIAFPEKLDLILALRDKETP